MGRWAQRRLRASGPAAPTPAPPAPLTLVSVEAAGTNWVLHWSGPVAGTTFVSGTEFFVGDATEFTPDGFAGSDNSGTDNGTGGYVSGLDWFLNSQPAWLTTPIAGPQSGTTI